MEDVITRPEKCLFCVLTGNFGRNLLDVVWASIDGGAWFLYQCDSSPCLFAGSYDHTSDLYCRHLDLYSMVPGLNMQAVLCCMYSLLPARRPDWCELSTPQSFIQALYVAHSYCST